MKVLSAPIEQNDSTRLTLWRKSVTDALSSSFAVKDLPSRDNGLGVITFATNGRKTGEGAGSGTGGPVWWDGNTWRTFYDNSQVLA